MSSPLCHPFVPAGRALLERAWDADLAIVGGGLAGTCAAITAARAGLKVVLLQDRPVLGGNGSSEVRLWTLGATCHMGSNNRWAREGGVIDEILVENLHRNPEGNALIFDTILLEKVHGEPGIALLLNTAVFECGKRDGDPERIAWVRGFCSQNSTLHRVSAPLFLDASGDGILGFLAGAAFRMGAENADEFGEPFAPTGDFGHLLGHSIYFYSKDAGRPVRFTPPAFALDDISGRIPRYRQFNAREHGCHLWWIEWGGRLDTVHESETIKWELWRVVYGVWNYIKNSGLFPEAENLTLEWVGHIPGKRESRRFEGPYLLSQRDIVQRPSHEDAVAFGGWSIDLHPADGVFAPIAGSHHLHSKGPYQIPFRCYYSRNLRNLFLGGRIISTSHVAFGSTRVMGTGAHGGQAVAIASALCRRWGCEPADLSADPQKIRVLQKELLRTGQHIWGLALEDDEDLAGDATVDASSRLRLGHLPADGENGWPLEKLSAAQLLPVAAGPLPRITLTLDVAAPCTATFVLRTSSRLDHHTPDLTLATIVRDLPAGTGVEVPLDFGVGVNEARCVFVCVEKNPHLIVRSSRRLVTGLVALEHSHDEKTVHVGGFDFPVYRPRRRPGRGENFALRVEPALDLFDPRSVLNGADRPTHQPNAWVADFADDAPRLALRWPRPRTFRRVVLGFDADFDHALESVLMGHSHRASPFCVKRFRLRSADGAILHVCDENHQGRNVVDLPAPVTTTELHLEILETNHPGVPAAVFAVRCYA